MQQALRRNLHSLPVKLSAGAALVALADFLFYDHPLGWAAGAYAMAVLGALAALHGGLLRQWQSQLVALMLFVLCGTFVHAPRPLAFGLYAFGIIALLILHKRSAPQDAWVWLKDVLRFALKGVMQWERDRNLLQARRRRKSLPVKPLATRATYAAIPALFAVIFAMLFAQANPVIGWLVEGIDWDFIEELLSPWRGLYWIGCGIAVWSLFRPRFSPAAPSARLALPAPDRWFSPDSIFLSLVLFNTLFGVQNALDVAFLWSGKPLPDGLTYAEYAHAGAYPLIFTALVAAVYILVTFSHRKYQTPATCVLVYLWIAQNIFLVVSAMNRDLHYIEVYSLTYLRLSALIWMGLVATGLALIVVKIRRAHSNMWLVNVNMLALIVTLYACCFVNFDRIIADYNARHAKEVTGTGTLLDLGYMQSLGPDAIPALHWFRNHARYSPTMATQAAELATREEQDLIQALDSDWRAWTWAGQVRLDDAVAQPLPRAEPIGATGWRTQE